MATGLARKTAGIYRKVVIATDFSPGSAMALKRLALLPLAPGAQVTIVHVLPPSTAGIDKALLKFTKEQLANEANTLRRLCDHKIIVTVGTLKGKAVQEIVQFAKKAKADLIVMGRHGMSNWKDALIGSVTERVVLQTETSVLIVGTLPHKPYTHPMAAVDDDEVAKRILFAMIAIAPDAPKATVFHAWGLPYESQMRRAGILQDVIKKERARWEEDVKRHLAGLATSVGAIAGLRVKLALRRGNPRYVVNPQAASFKADLIVISSNSRPGFAHLILGSVAQEVVRGAERDVLVVRGKMGRHG